MEFRDRFEEKRAFEELRNMYRDSINLTSDPYCIHLDGEFRSEDLRTIANYLDARRKFITGKPQTEYVVLLEQMLDEIKQDGSMSQMNEFVKIKTLIFILDSIEELRKGT